jgi:aspartyl protease family protein
MWGKWIFLLLFIILITSLYNYFPDAIDIKSSPQIIITIIIIVIYIIFSPQKHILKTLKSLLIWLILFATILILYSYKQNLKNIYYQVMTNIAPGKFIIAQDNTFTIKANINGQYHIQALVNNYPVDFLIDTGASMVSIPVNLAKKIGFNTDNLKYNQIFSTANGNILCATTYNNIIRIVDFSVNKVSISICPNELSTPLLGMNFLQYLKKISVENEEMILQY